MTKNAEAPASWAACDQRTAWASCVSRTGSTPISTTCGRLSPIPLVWPAGSARWRATSVPAGRSALYFAADDVESTGRVEACEPPRRLLVTTRETDESYQKGQGVPPFDESVEATLSADGDRTILVVEVRGMPLDKIAFYGAGWQIHAEDLAAYLAGREPGDVEARWEELVPPYQALAASVT